MKLGDIKPDLHRRIEYILNGGIMEGETEPFFSSPVPSETEIHDYTEYNPNMLFALFVVNERCIMWYYEDTTGLYDVTETFNECGKDFDKTAQAIFDAEEDF